MADPAMTQIVTAMKTLLEAGAWTNSGNDPQIFTDRDDSEPIQPGERPAIVIRVVDVDLTERPEYDQSVQHFAFTIDLDLYEDADITDNITVQHDKRAADTVAILADDWTLGGKCYTLDPMSLTAAADSVPAAGVAILTFSGATQTRRDDWTTIVV